MFTTIPLGLLLSALGQTITSSALRTIAGDIGGSGHPSRTLRAYMLAETIAAVPAGKSGDLFGRTRIFQAGIDVFIAGSLVCALVNSMPVLVAARALQSMGAGGPVVTADTVSGVSAVIGPLLGGVLTDQLSWKPTR
ncbi:MFS transporter [Streptomyces galilaeus]